MSQLLGESYRALYQNYYGDGAVATKRGMSAVDAAAHIKAMVVMAGLRRSALRVSPRLAPWAFTYLFVAYCAPDSPEE